jgi:hypothetical protein
MAQAVECLPRKLKALNSNPSSAKKGSALLRAYISHHARLCGEHSVTVSFKFLTHKTLFKGHLMISPFP